LPLKEGLPADDFNQAIMNKQYEKKASSHFVVGEWSRNQGRIHQDCQCRITSLLQHQKQSKFSPIKKPFVAVSTGTSCYQSRSKSSCFFEPCSPCTRYTPDAWIPMDASFKQYTYSDGMDLQQAVPLDAAALISAAGQGAQVNEAEGWVQHLNTAALQGQLSAYQQRLKTYIDRQNGGQSTVGQVLGQRSAQIDPLPFFAATLPYEVKARI